MIQSEFLFKKSFKLVEDWKLEVMKFCAFDLSYFFDTKQRYVLNKLSTLFKNMTVKNKVSYVTKL